MRNQPKHAQSLYGLVRFIRTKYEHYRKLKQHV